MNDPYTQGFIDKLAEHGIEKAAVRGEQLIRQMVKSYGLTPHLAIKHRRHLSTRLGLPGEHPVFIPRLVEEALTGEASPSVVSYLNARYNPFQESASSIAVRSAVERWKNILSPKGARTAPVDPQDLKDAVTLAKEWRRAWRVPDFDLLRIPHPSVQYLKPTTKINPADLSSRPHLAAQAQKDHLQGLKEVYEGATRIQDNI